MAEVLEPKPLDPERVREQAKEMAERAKSFRNEYDKIMNERLTETARNEKLSDMIKEAYKPAQISAKEANVAESLGTKTSKFFGKFTDLFMKAFANNTTQTMTVEVEGGGMSEATIDANATMEDVINKVFEIFDKALDATGKEKLQNLKTKITATIGKEPVEFTAEEFENMSKSVEDAFNSKNAPELNTELKKIRDLINDKIKNTKAEDAEAMKNLRQALLDIVDEGMSSDKMKKIIEEAEKRRATSTTPDPNPKLAAWAWDFVKFLAILGGSGFGIWGIFGLKNLIGEYCMEHTGCFKIESSPTGPKSTKVYCKSGKTYSEAYCGCVSDAGDISQTDCTSDNMCKCYPDQTPENGIAKYDSCKNTSGSDFLYYTYQVMTPIDAIGNLVADAGNFLSSSTQNLFYTILKWGLIILATVMGLLLVYSVTRFLTEQELKKLIK